VQGADARGTRVAHITIVSYSQHTIGEHFERLGHVPLPPYIDRADETSDRERYQTVFAKNPGAVPHPPPVCTFQLKSSKKFARGRGDLRADLDVGLGTFQPIHGETLEGHVMHAEAYEIPSETATASTLHALLAGPSWLSALPWFARWKTPRAARPKRVRSNLVVAGKAAAQLLLFQDVSSAWCKACSQTSLAAFDVTRSCGCVRGTRACSCRLPACG